MATPEAQWVLGHLPNHRLSCLFAQFGQLVNRGMGPSMIAHFKENEEGKKELTAI